MDINKQILLLEKLTGKKVVLEESNIIRKLTNCWVSPEGEITEVPIGLVHRTVIEELGLTEEGALASGWVRVVCEKANNKILAMQGEKKQDVVNILKTKFANLLTNIDELILEWWDNKGVDGIWFELPEERKKLEMFLAGLLEGRKINSKKVILEKESKFKKLEDNKIPLTDEERKEVFKRDAVWNYMESIDPNTGKKVKKISAVWKSKDPKTGEITYVTNTHRAYNTAPTLKGAIGRYHKFIKGTA